MLDPDAFTVFTSLGWCLIAALFASAVASAAFLALVVGRMKKSLDFAFTVYFLHVVCVSSTYAFPQNTTWWLCNTVCFVITAGLGEYLCLRKELQDISVDDILRGSARTRQRAGSAHSSSGPGTARTDVSIPIGPTGGVGSGQVAGAGAAAGQQGGGGTIGGAAAAPYDAGARQALDAFASPSASLASNVSAALTNAIDRLHLPGGTAEAVRDGSTLLRRGYANATRATSTWLTASSTALRGGYGGFSRLPTSEWEPAPVRPMPGTVSYSTPKKGSHASTSEQHQHGYGGSSAAGPISPEAHSQFSRARIESSSSLQSYGGASMAASPSPVALSVRLEREGSEGSLGGARGAANAVQRAAADSLSLSLGAMSTTSSAVPTPAASPAGVAGPGTGGAGLRATNAIAFELPVLSVAMRGNGSAAGGVGVRERSQGTQANTQ